MSWHPRSDGERCTRCNGNYVDLSLYAEDSNACPPRWLEGDELAARLRELDRPVPLPTSCRGCGSRRHDTEDCG